MEEPCRPDKNSIATLIYLLTMYKIFLERSDIFPNCILAERKNAKYTIVKEKQ